MRIVKETIPATSLGATVNFQPYNLTNLGGYAFMASITGAASPVGVLKIQVSNNAFADNVNNNIDPNAVWDDLPGSAVNVSGNGTFSFNVTDVYYEACRLVYTRTSGSATATVYVFAKGIV